jgi:hypothetical protein
MSAATRTIREAWSAFGAFLRGFVGVIRDSDASGDCRRPHETRHRSDAGVARPTAASVRAALSERAASRRSCC